MAVALKIIDASKKFGTIQALTHVNLDIMPGELFFLLGPSGCGKTTLLRAIAGFHTLDSGQILMGAEDITHTPPHLRDTGMMFQSYALWPHLTIAENVAFGLEMRKLTRSVIKTRVAEALALVHLGDRAQARPNQLSGGQQQRVALARAIVTRPRCLLLDEPLSNLDAKLRLEMRLEIRNICKQAGLTALYVTHDQKEALSVADRMAIMQEGHLAQIGTPQEVYRHPRTPFVANFIGECNFMTGYLEGETSQGYQLSTPLGPLYARHKPDNLTFGQKIKICLRPETLQIDPLHHPPCNLLNAHYQASIYLGETAQHTLRLSNPEKPAAPITLTALEINPPIGQHAPGRELKVWLAPEDIIVLLA